MHIVIQRDSICLRQNSREPKRKLFTPGVSDPPGPLASSLINKKSPEPRINTPLSVSPIRPTPAQHKT